MDRTTNEYDVLMSPIMVLIENPILEVIAVIGSLTLIVQNMAINIW